MPAGSSVGRRLWQASTGRLPGLLVGFLVSGKRLYFVHLIISFAHLVFEAYCHDVKPVWIRSQYDLEFVAGACPRAASASPLMADIAAGQFSAWMYR